MGTEAVAQPPPQAFQHELVRFWEQLDYNGAAMSCAFITFMAMGGLVDPESSCRGPSAGAKLLQDPGGHPRSLSQVCCGSEWGLGTTSGLGVHSRWCTPGSTVGSAPLSVYQVNGLPVSPSPGHRDTQCFTMFVLVQVHPWPPHGMLTSERCLLARGRLPTCSYTPLRPPGPGALPSLHCL